MSSRSPHLVSKLEKAEVTEFSPAERAGPVLLQADASPQPRYSLLALWHLLSLDAPTVAAVWTWFIARSAGVKLPWTSPAAMFLAVWMLYAADRLLDARAPGAGNDLEERHRFHHAHRTRFMAGLAGASVLLAALLPQRSATELSIFAALGSLLFAYFFLIHLWPPTTHIGFAKAARLPKELAVGVFFPAAVFIPTVARAPELRFHLLPNALLLAAVCTLNCLYVYKWEHPGKPRHTHWTTRHATRHLTALCSAVALVSVAAAIAFLSSNVHQLLFFPAIACAVSATLLLLLDASRNHLKPVVLRALVGRGAAHAAGCFALCIFAAKMNIEPTPAGAANFDRVARMYRWAEYLALGSALQRTRTHFLPALDDRRSAFVLGDGDGRFLAALFSGNPGIEAIAVDTSQRMLQLLSVRCAFAQERLRTVHTSFLDVEPSKATDLIVCHFFLDCLEQRAVEQLAQKMAMQCEGGTLWLISDFQVPAHGWKRPVAAAYIRLLYFAFRVLTGLKVQRLPDTRTALHASGFRRIQYRESLGGMIYTELWRLEARP